MLESDAYQDVMEYRTAPTDDMLADDDTLDTWIRQTVGTSRHVSGTCRIGPDGDPMAVTDQQCRVRGVQGLWVADSSIMPQVTRANTGPHTRANAGTHARADTESHARADTRRHARADAQSHTRADTGAHARGDTGAHARGDIGVHARADAGVHVSAAWRTHVRAGGGTHKCLGTEADCRAIPAFQSRSSRLETGRARRRTGRSRPAGSPGKPR